MRHDQIPNALPVHRVSSGNRHTLGIRIEQACQILPSGQADLQRGEVTSQPIMNKLLASTTLP